MRRRRCIAIVAAALLCVAPLKAAADSAPECAVNSPGFAFTYDPMAVAAVESISTIRLSCANVSGPLALAVDLSAGLSNSYASRVLAGPRSSRLAYNVFSNVTSSVFGDGTAATVHYQRVLPPNGTLAADAFAIRLLVPPGQDLPPGTYADTLELRVNF